MKFKFSLFGEPQKVEIGDVLVACLAFSLFVIFGPEAYFAKVKIGLGSYCIFILASILLGMISTHFARKKSPAGPDVFYIRAWWALISGAVALPVCLFFRIESLPVVLIMMVVGGGEIAGNLIFRRFFGA